MAKLNTKTVIYSVTTFSTLVYILCGLFYALFPQQAIDFFNTLFHGIDITSLAKEMSLTRFIIGIIETIILSVILSWIFVKIYNYFAK